MRRSTARAAFVVALLGTTITGCTQEGASGNADANSSAQSSAATAPACDRDCLIKATDAYVAALAAHDPKAAPLADNVAIVENARKLKPGEGLWKTTTAGATQFSIHVPDVDQQQAGWIGMIQQDGKPAMLALRLKLQDGKITEAEHIVANTTRAKPEDIQTVRPGLLAQIPEAQRLPHDQLIKIGATYYDALDDNDGSKMPFAADCQRRENGMTTAGEGAMGPPDTQKTKQAPVAKDCKGQMDSQSFKYIETIDDRRMVAADPVTGLAMGFSHFHHSFKNLPYQVKHVDGSTSERNAKNMPYKPFDMPAAHIFKIGPEGQVHEIEAVGATIPYNSPTGRE